MSTSDIPTLDPAIALRAKAEREATALGLTLQQYAELKCEALCAAIRDRIAELTTPEREVAA